MLELNLEGQREKERRPVVGNSIGSGGRVPEIIDCYLMV